MGVGSIVEGEGKADGQLDHLGEENGGRSEIATLGSDGSYSRVVQCLGDDGSVLRSQRV